MGANETGTGIELGVAAGWEYCVKSMEGAKSMNTADTSYV